MAQTVSSPITQRTSFFYGWVIVGVCVIINGLSGNLGTYFGLFVVPIQSELLWDRTTVVFAATTGALMGAVVQPFIGPFLDRYGGRVMTVIAGIIGGTALACGGLANEPWQLYLAYGLYGAAANGVGLQVTNVVVAKWFITKRGRALGFAAMGLSASNLIMVPLLQVIISNSGWRFAFLILGLIVGIGLAVPAAIFLRRQPEDMGLLPDGAAPVAARQEAGSTAPVAMVDVERSMTLREALNTRSFYLLLVAWMLAGLPVMAAFIHTIPYLTGDNGISPGMAASAWTVWFAFGTMSKLVWGFISERIPARFSMAACLFGEAAGMAMLLNVGQSVPLLFLWGVIGGTGHGPFAQFQTLVFANYYGRRHLGSIRGFLMPFIVVSGAAGPILAAYLFQLNGNYHTVWMVFVIMLVIAGTLALISLPPKRREPQ